MLIEYMKPDFVLQNENGRLIQLVHDNWKQVNYITSAAGCIRGGHCHEHNSECFYVISGKFRLKLKKDGVTEEYLIAPGTMFRIGPFVYHTFEYLEETALISMYSSGVEEPGGRKDIIADPAGKTM